LDEAVGLYQSSQGLLADQRIDFDLYASLISGDLAQGRVQPEDFSPASFSPNFQRPKEVLRFSISTDKGRQRTFKAGETFVFTMQPSSDAFAYCYYKDAANTVVRVFPNRFQPDALVAAGSNVRVPGEAAHFEMVLEGPGDQEEVLCLASSLELGLRLPEHLKAADLTPMRVSSLEEVAQSFRRVSRGQVVEARLPIRVKR
jgi:hypothetical protein